MRIYSISLALIYKNRWSLTFQEICNFILLIYKQKLQNVFFIFLKKELVLAPLYNLKFISFN